LRSRLLPLLYRLSSFQGTRLLLEFTSLQSCVEESSFSEFTCRRRRKATEGISHSFKTERSDCLESASLQLCAEESIFLEPAGRRRRKVAPLNSLLRWFASRNSASPNPLVDADANETTS